MSRKNLSEYKRKYNAFRHHAWAGLGFLSVLLVIRIIVPSLSELIHSILIVLIIYVVVALLFTYKYYEGLMGEKIIQIQPSDEIEKERMKVEVEKERLKVEKKKTKAEAKKAKKAKKIK
jgi:membrane protein implicated in regulation of membrane protease activity